MNHYILIIFIVIPADVLYRMNPIKQFINDFYLNAYTVIHASGQCITYVLYSMYGKVCNYESTDI